MNTKKKLPSLFPGFVEIVVVLDFTHLSKGGAIMKKSKIINSIKNIALGFCALALISCGGFGTIVKMPVVKEVPAGQYERIIKLNNPEGAPDKKIAGFVFIKKGANVCTDYPRQEIIKSLDELTMMEKNAYRYFSNHVIEAGGKTFGFVSIPIDYRIILWENEKDENCQYKVQIISINRERGAIGEEIPRVGPGGSHSGGQ